MFWLDAELGLYLQESLRTFQAASQFYRDRCSFTASASTAFYDLTDTSSTGSGGSNPPALLGPTLKDRDLVNTCQYHLIENVNDFSSSSVWAGTDMFTMADVVNALQHRRDQFNYETGLILSRSTPSMPAPTNNKITLDDSITDLRRVAWRDTAGATNYTLRRSDNWNASAFKVGWNATSGIPSTYSVIMTLPTVVQVMPIPSLAATLDIVTVNAGAALDVTTGVKLGIPDDFAWVVKWGALADLLGRDGQSRDPARADYCEKRWRDGIELAKLTASTLYAEIGSTSTFITSLNNLDTFNFNWQNTSGTPTLIGQAGWNLLALAPVPTGSTTITLDVVRNMSVPSSGSDQIQVGREHLDVILDYAEHLACFKMGGAEFMATMPHYERLMRVAMLTNDRLRANSKQFDVLQERRKKHEQAERRFTAANE